MTYKRYYFCTVCIAGFILAAIAFFDYKMDPGNIFENDLLLENCGSWLLDGHDIAITQNYDERLLQKYLAEHDEKNYQVVVYGSSRTMDIGRDFFSDMSLQNYSVSGASVEDDIALYFLYERLHGTPQKVILGADAWLLNRNNDQTRWKSIAEEYMYGQKLLSGAGQPKGVSMFEGNTGLEKYVQLISWPYFKESVKKFKKNQSQENIHAYCLVDEGASVPTNADIICSDGSRLPSADARARDAEPLAREYISGNVYSLEGYERLDEDWKKEFRAFIQYLIASGIDVTLYLTPYHPIVYSYLANTEKYRNVQAAEEFFKQLAAEYGVRIVGSYNPAKCGLSNEDFLDGMHMRREAVRRILEGKL